MKEPTNEQIERELELVENLEDKFWELIQSDERHTNITVYTVIAKVFSSMIKAQCEEQPERHVEIVGEGMNVLKEMRAMLITASNELMFEETRF